MVGLSRAGLGPGRDMAGRCGDRWVGRCGERRGSEILGGREGA